MSGTNLAATTHRSHCIHYHGFSAWTGLNIGPFGHCEKLYLYRHATSTSLSAGRWRNLGVFNFSLFVVCSIMQCLLLGVRIYIRRYFSSLFHSMHMTNQVMWFQGRDDGIDKEVVSLSTGRIYKATSEDGLKWTLESGPGACESSLDVNEEEWWSFDTAHLGLGGECYRGLSEDCLWCTEFVDSFPRNNELQLTSCLFFGRYAPTLYHY